MNCSENILLNIEEVAHNIKTGLETITSHLFSELIKQIATNRRVGLD